MRSVAEFYTPQREPGVSLSKKGYAQIVYDRI